MLSVDVVWWAVIGGIEFCWRTVEKYSKSPQAGHVASHSEYPMSLTARSKSAYSKYPVHTLPLVNHRSDVYAGHWLTRRFVQISGLRSWSVEGVGMVSLRFRSSVQWKGLREAESVVKATNGRKCDSCLGPG